MPAIIERRASGNSTLYNSCLSVEPKARAASLISDGTCLIPKAVNLTIGGIANITVAIIPGGFPTEKKATAGIKYTNEGIVCITSRIGLVIVSARFDFPTKTPKGSPIAQHIKVAVNTKAIVSIAVFQKPNKAR